MKNIRQIFAGAALAIGFALVPVLATSQNNDPVAEAPDIIIRYGSEITEDNASCRWRSL